MSKNTFDVLMLIARPAAGKSEIIHYLKNIPVGARAERFHIGKMDEIDDFPMLWTWFEEDELLEKMGHERLHSDAQGYFKGQHLWNLLIRRIGLEYARRLRDSAGDADPVTTLVEFARGAEHGGFRAAFDHITSQLAERAAILYIDVSFEESLRKNRRRYNPNRPDSILEHGLSDEKMERLYRDSDWNDLSSGQSEGRLNIAGVEVPFAVFSNDDDVTTPGGEPLGRRLEDRLGRLWQLYQAGQGQDK